MNSLKPGIQNTEYRIQKRPPVSCLLSPVFLILFTVSCLLSPVFSWSQTNVLTGNTADVGLAGTRANVTLTLRWPNPRTYNNSLIVQDPVTVRTDSSGDFSFTNILWGAYDLTVSGQRGTPFKIYVGTNTVGTVAIASLVTNSAALPPNTGTNYYTIAQIDAIISAIGSGTGTNVWAGDTDAIYPEVAGSIDYGASITFTDYTTNRVIDATALTNIWNDIVFPLVTLNPPGAPSAGAIVFTNGPSGEHSSLVLGANNTVYVSFQMPHTWTAGTDVKPHFHIEPQTANSITSTWRVATSVADIGSAFPSSTVVTQTVVIAASNQYVHRLVNIPTNGIDMSSFSGPSTVGKIYYLLLSTSEPLHVQSYDVHYRYGGTPVTYDP